MNSASELITYEQPLNERIRTFLRIEHLFGQVEHFLAASDIWSTRTSVAALLDLMSVFARSDIKNEILKELERHTGVLGRMSRHPDINMEVLDQILENLERSTSRMYRVDGQIGHNVRDDELLKAITQRSSIPGGTCSFDLPSYHFWLCQPHQLRRQQILDWLGELSPVRDAVDLLLSLTRGSKGSSEEVAVGGVFQRGSNANNPGMMVRVELDPELGVYPEISGNKHRYSIRFLSGLELPRSVQTEQDVPFILTYCCL